jgi:PAS domain-containing protein
LLSLVETLRDGILLIDEDQRVTVANSSFRRILGMADPVQVGGERGWPRLLAKLQPLSRCSARASPTPCGCATSWPPAAP